MERWCPVLDVHGRFVEGYQISSRGRVRSYLVTGRNELTPRPRLKASFPDRAGFINITLRTGKGRSTIYLLHHLVAIAFLGPRPSRRHVVIHKNHDRTDNRAANLQWVTRSEASEHAMKARPRRGIHARFTPAKVRAIRASKQTVRQIAARHGVTVQSIYAIRKRKTWKDVK